MQGEWRLAWSNRSRTRLAPTPTNISTNSEPEIEKKGTPASPETALASRVLPVPGGPTSSTPLGMRAPSWMNFCGSRRNSTTSLQLFLGFLHTGHIVKRDGGMVAGEHAGPRFSERHGGIVAALRLAEDPPEDASQAAGTAARSPAAVTIFIQELGALTSMLTFAGASCSDVTPRSNNCCRESGFGFLARFAAPRLPCRCRRSRSGLSSDSI